MVAVGVIYFLSALQMPLIGDDLGYREAFARKFGDIPVFGTLRKMRGHWLDINGRFSDMANVIFLYHIPHWLLAVISGVMVSVFLWLVNLWCFDCRKGYVTMRIALIALIVFTFPWWDSYMLFVVQMGYLWSAAWVLATLYVMLRTDWPDSRYARWPLAFAALLAGWLHEACGPAVSLGLFIYILVNRGYWREWTPGRRVMLIAFFIGAFLTLLSPALWLRFRSVMAATTDDPFFVLLVKNTFFVLLLLVVLIVESFAHPQRLKGLCRTPWLVFVLAALSSALVSAAGGVMGRPGWFAQSFAVIAIVQWMFTYRLPRISTLAASSVSTLLTLVIISHLGAFLIWQVRMERQLNEVISRFEKNPAQYIYMDYIRPADVPWYVLGKTLGAYDENDYWPLQMEMEYHGGNRYWPVILPERLKNFDFKDVKLPYNGGDFLLLLNPEGYSGRNIEREIDGELYVCVPIEQAGRKMYYARKLYLAPGERPL